MTALTYTFADRGRFLIDYEKRARTLRAQF
jgi:hypothetical protein